MLDGRIASEYYNDINAGGYVVYFDNGKRIDNNQVWTKYNAGPRLGICGRYANWTVIWQNNGSRCGIMDNGRACNSRSIEDWASLSQCASAIGYNQAWRWQ